MLIGVILLVASSIFYEIKEGRRFEHEQKGLQQFVLNAKNPKLISTNEGVFHNFWKFDVDGVEILVFNDSDFLLRFQQKIQNQH